MKTTYKSFANLLGGIMSEFILSGCSTADLTKEHFIERDIHYICFHYEMDGKQYIDDLGETMSSEDFFSGLL